MRALDDYNNQVMRQLIMQKEALIELFVASGAFLRDLRLEIGPLEVKTQVMLDGSLIIDVYEEIRIV